MKKITLLFSMILMMCFSAKSQVQVGFETNSSQYLPFSPYHQNSYSQSIYLASEIGASGIITTIQWYYTGSTAIPYSQDLVVYIGTTTKSVFASKTDWESVSNLTQVYAGGITTNSTPGWKTITLTTPFNYNGTDNLIVAVDENKVGGDAFTDKFKNSSVTGARSIVYYTSTTTNADPTSPPAANTTPSYIPNIIFGGISQGCPAPFNLAVTAITTSGAKVEWTTPSALPSEPSQYYLSTSNVPPTANTNPTGYMLLNEFFKNLTGLNSGTKYYICTRHNCGGGNYSNWSDILSFTTLCTPVATFNEDFDGVTAPALPTCWSGIVRGTNVCTSAVKTAAVSTSFSTPNVLSLFNCNSDGEYDIMAVSPVLSNLGAGTHRLRFQAAATIGSTIQVGTVNVNNNTAVFNPIQTIENLTPGFTQYIADFSGYKGTDNYIAIRVSELNPKQNTVYLDNIVWEFKPWCPNVTEVKVVSVTHSTVTVGWTESGTETQWEVAVGPQSVSDPSELDPFHDFHKTPDSGSLIVGGLQGTTAYKAWVRSVCDGLNGEGAWIGPVLFTTGCQPVSTFSENFNGQKPYLPQCWSSIIRANSGVIANGTKIVTDGDQYNKIKDGNYALIKNNGSIGDFDLILVSPPLTNIAAGTHRLRFWANSANEVQIGTLESSTGSALFTPYKKVNTLNGLAEYFVYFDTPPTAIEQMHIGIRMSNTAGKFAALGLDNITWEPIPACPEVTQVSVPETSTSGAVVTWKPQGSESRWQVAVGDTTVADPNTITPQPADGPEPMLPIGGLHSGTEYRVWVRAVCDGKGYGDWIGPVVFITECPPVTEFWEGFDSITITPSVELGNYSVNEIPACWTKVLRGAGLVQNAYVRTTKANTSFFPNFTMPNSVVISPQDYTNADVILVSPNISTLGQAYRLTFDSFYPGTIEIGVLDGNTNASTFTVFKTITLSGYYGGKTIVNFTGYDGLIFHNNHIGIRVVPNPTTMPIINIDNIIWEPVPTCPDITTKISVYMTSPNNATFNWDKAGSETGWQIAIHPNNPNANDAIHKDVTMMSAPSMLVGGLNPNTTYYVWVRTVCGANNYGAWCTPTKFVTPCLAVDIPYSENFQTATNGAIPECTDVVTADILGVYWKTSPYNPYGFSTSHIRCFEGAKTKSWFFTKGVNLVQGATYRMSYLKGTSAPLTGGCGEGTCGPVNFKVMYGSSPIPDGMNNTLKDYVGLTGPASSDYEDFTVPSTGVYYFGFYNYSDDGHGELALDNILIDTALGNENFDLSKFNYYPIPVKDVLNISYSENVNSVSLYNLLGQLVLQQAINVTKGTVDLSMLSKGTYLLKVDINNIVKTVKIIKD